MACRAAQGRRTARNQRNVRREDWCLDCSVAEAVLCLALLVLCLLVAGRIDYLTWKDGMAW